MNQSTAWIPVVSGSVLASIGLLRRSRGGYALAAVGGAILVGGVRGWRRCDRRPDFARGVMVKKAIRVAASPDRCYAFWRKLENLPQFMEHIESIRILDDTRSHWKARTVAGATAEWDAEIITDRPNEIIGWRSLPESELATAGSVRFERTRVGDPGTKVHVVLKYNPPGGAVTATVLNLLGESPEQQLGNELKRFRSIIEGVGDVSPRDEVDLASEDSFPASDPPAWNSAV